MEHKLEITWYIYTETRTRYIHIAPSIALAQWFFSMSQNQILLRLEGTSGGHLVQPPACIEQVQLQVGSGCSGPRPVISGSLKKQKFYNFSGLKC